MSRSVLVRKIPSLRRRRGPGGRSRFLALAPVAGGLALAMALPATAATTATATRAAPAGPAAAAPKITALPKSGIWTALSAGMTVEVPAPAFWVAPNGVGWDVFPRQIAPNVFTYEAAQVGTSGKVIKAPADIFATHWGALEFPATLLGIGTRPLLVFSGEQGSYRRLQPRLRLRRAWRSGEVGARVVVAVQQLQQPGGGGRRVQREREGARRCLAGWFRRRFRCPLPDRAVNRHPRGAR